MTNSLSLAVILSAAIVSTAAAEGNSDKGKTLFSRCAVGEGLGASGTDWRRSTFDATIAVKLWETVEWKSA